MGGKFDVCVGVLFVFIGMIGNFGLDLRLLIVLMGFAMVGIGLEEWKEGWRRDRDAR
jgi:hypothetical protein